MSRRLSRSVRPSIALVTVIAIGTVLSGHARSVLPAFGDPLPGLSAADRALFTEGRQEFEAVEGVADGLGPTFNDVSCASCHNEGASGGGSARAVTRYGRLDGGVFDPLTAFGGSLIHERGIGPQGSCTYTGESVPSIANVVAHRRTTPLFGLGLVEAVPDDEIRSLAALERLLAPGQAGRVATVDDLVAGGTRVGRFGWKAQVPTLLQFSADAYLNEMGITSPVFPAEHCPQGDCGLLVCDPAHDPEDADGTDIRKFTDFMRFLAAPPRGAVTRDAAAGGLVFVQAGCANCHAPTLVTGPSGTPALDRKVLFPYSDFLLHDMGPLADGIGQGAATPREMRTAPLWGNRVVTTFLHDGRATTLDEAILAHDGQGRAARDAFAALSAPHKRQLIAFVRSL